MVYSSTLPSAPTGTIARLAIVWFGRLVSRLFHAPARMPLGPTCIAPSPSVRTATTSSTTARTPVTGTPPRPATCNDTVCPAAGCAPVSATADSGRVSSTRTGVVSGTYFDVAL